MALIFNVNYRIPWEIVFHINTGVFQEGEAWIRGLIFYFFGKSGIY
jgi:hypothetical protein